jgi:hypothetical protein
MWELKTATFEEITEASNTLHLTAKICQSSIAIWIKVGRMMVVEILGNHNVAAQNQYIGTFVIVYKTIRKFQM